MMDAECELIQSESADGGDLCRIEAIYVRTVQARDRAWERLHAIMHEHAEVGAVGADVKPTHCHTGDDPADPPHLRGVAYWWRYKWDDRWISFDWIPSPDPVLHGDVGIAIHSAYRYYVTTAAQRVALARATLVRACQRTMHARGLAATFVRLRIGGHSYLWRRSGWGMEPFQFYGDVEHRRPPYAEVTIEARPAEGK